MEHSSLFLPKDQHARQIDFLQFQQNFAEVIGKKTTFLDDSSFHYKEKVQKYFDGDPMLPSSNQEEFLTVLQAVLQATEVEEEMDVDRTSVQEAVRGKFLELYDENSETLLATDHDVHEMVTALNRRSLLPMMSYDRNPMLEQVQSYLSEESSEVIEKYLAQEMPANPEENGEEFYLLYKAVIQICPQGFGSRSMNMSMVHSKEVVPSRSDTLRDQFDSLYDSHRQGLAKVWSEKDYARDIEQLRRLPFQPQFTTGYPTMQMQYRSDRKDFPSYRGQQYYHEVDEEKHFSRTQYGQRSFGSFETSPPSFREIQSRYSEFNFEQYGLESMSSRIIAFYDGELDSFEEDTPRNFPFQEKDFFIVLKAVLTAFSDIDTRSPSAEGALKTKFIELFREGSESSSYLGSSQVTFLDSSQQRELQSLIGPSFRESLDTRSLHRRGKPTSHSGNGGNFVRVALLILAAYLTYRFVGKPAYQWYRGKNAPVAQ